MVDLNILVLKRIQSLCLPIVIFRADSRVPADAGNIIAEACEARCPIASTKEGQLSSLVLVNRWSPSI
ncbi:hypothetical protein KC333_g172 [Hortaea werneckii]|nr:hypothetical protein KC333_g172 [Hortaea werneckii]